MKFQHSRPGRLAVVITAAVALAGLAQTAAHAAGPNAYHGSDKAWTDGGVRIWVDDREADNHGVHAEYRTRNGHTYTIGDANGSAAPAGTELSEDGSVILNWRVCEATEGCGSWAY
ncbi:MULTISPECIES: hypothetical protein [unclassified Streptosporangium]|uniref:hypothetical protein n=1 Tax=unclassified Streptosporangium TaxID=2632669 RepID=UPI002E2BF425|nr:MULTISPECIES: hypothetical protein [unclassified Streptosporangium]